MAAGGWLNVATPLASAEIFSPTPATWAATGSLGTAREFHSATLLGNGNLLVTGGQLVAGNGTSLIGTTEVFNWASQTWAYSGALNDARVLHSATLLGDGSVLAAFGLDADVVSEIYVP
jgi:hypothetical protein